jgi:MFS family permease
VVREGVVWAARPRRLSFWHDAHRRGHGCRSRGDRRAARDWLDCDRNAFEWYDFLVYSYLATVISKNFFAGGAETAALLATFAAFGLGFVARPLGAMVIGLIGDKYGRKPALVLTLSLMGAGTVAIGLVPSYVTIGVLAPALLVFARLVQGFSVGGEWGSSTAFIAEWTNGEDTIAAGNSSASFQGFCLVPGSQRF